MAGSYEATVESLTNAAADEEWIPIFDNVGDAHEAAHEMAWLILRAIGHSEALRLLGEEYYPMCRGEMQPDEHLKRLAE